METKHSTSQPPVDPNLAARRQAGAYPIPRATQSDDVVALHNLVHENTARRLAAMPFEPKSNEPPDYGSLASHSPKEPRDQQPIVLQAMQEALLDDNIKYLIIDSPTGTGKSVLGMAAGRASGFAVMGPPTKYLQDQLERDFSDKLVTVKGRANYFCHRAKGKNVTVDRCESPGDGCGQCAYEVQLSKASRAKVSSLNTSALLNHLNFSDRWEPRRLYVLDEAHRLQTEITKFSELELNTSVLRDYDIYTPRMGVPEYNDVESYMQHIKVDILPAAKRRQVELEKLRDDKSMRLKIRIKEIRTRAELMLDTVTQNTPDVVHFNHIRSNDGHLEAVVLQPVNIALFAKNFLFDKGKKFVLLSATFLNHDYYLQNMGIPPEQARVIKVPSVFPPENRPIYHQEVAVGHLNYRSLPQLLPALRDRVAGIMQHHRNEKGIIFTPSYKLANDIFFGLPKDVKDRIIYPQTASAQAEALDKHINSRAPTVLLSPSMAEGLDLEGDLSRFQIMTKLPWPSLGDAVVKCRMDLNPISFPYDTALTLVQSYGRSIRNKKDYCVSYMLDSGFRGFVNNHRDLLPDWFLEALVPAI